MFDSMANLCFFQAAVLIIDWLVEYIQITFKSSYLILYDFKLVWL